VLAFVFVLPAPRAHAFEWQDLWQRRDQRGYEALQAEQAARAAQLFKNPEWRGAAEYRAGQFEDSAVTLANLDTANGHYNRGNALAKAGALEPAIAEYDRALELDANHEDARYNRDLVAQFLKDNPQEQQQPQNQGEGQQGEQGDSSQQQQQDGQQQDGQQGSQDQQGEQGESGQDQAGNDATDQPEERNDGEPQGEEQTQQDANAGEEPANGEQQTPGPEDVEKWASEQAAEQWLRRVPQDPGGLLRRKFLYQYQRLGVDQNGNRVEAGAAERRPW
jgi:Ca-activated chloride channel family protein